MASPVVFLKRVRTGPQGTEGILTCNQFHCYTLELPWRNNEKGRSCIALGNYRCLFGFSPARKIWTYRLQDVPGRSGVLIHSGNYAGDISLGFRTHVQGCILLGEKKGRMEGQLAVLLSRPTVAKFESYMERKAFSLVVEAENPEAFGEDRLEGVTPLERPKPRHFIPDDDGIDGLLREVDDGTGVQKGS